MDWERRFPKRFCGLFSKFRKTPSRFLNIVQSRSVIEEKIKDLLPTPAVHVTAMFSCDFFRKLRYIRKPTRRPPEEVLIVVHTRG
jgi:hypothetical protein